MTEENTVDTAAEAAPVEAPVAESPSEPVAVEPVAEAPAAEAAPVEASDFVPAREADAMFKGNPGLSAVKVQVDDGRIGFLSRDGAFAPVAVGE